MTHHLIFQMVGSLEADSMEAVGKAQAEEMRMKAAAYRQYGSAALLSMVLKSMPKVCTDLVGEEQFSKTRRK